jgi:hypothetical protein
MISDYPSKIPQIDDKKTGNERPVKVGVNLRNIDIYRARNLNYICMTIICAAPQCLMKPTYSF